MIRAQKIFLLLLLGLSAIGYGELPDPNPNGPFRVVIKYLESRGVPLSAIPTNDPVWKQTCLFLERNSINVEIGFLPDGASGRFFGGYKTDPRTGEHTYNGDSLVRGGKIIIDPNNVTDPRQLLGTLVHETNHARRWIDVGGRVWDWDSGDIYMTQEDFVARNRLRAVGDESLAYLRTAKFLERNGLPLSPLETKVIAAAKNTEGKSKEAVRQEIRELIMREPEYEGETGELLRSVLQAVRRDRELHPGRPWTYYKGKTTSELLALSRPKRPPLPPPIRKSQIILRCQTNFDAVEAGVSH